MDEEFQTRINLLKWHNRTIRNMADEMTLDLEELCFIPIRRYKLIYIGTKKHI